MIDDSVPTYLLCIGSLLKLGYLEFKIGYGHASKIHGISKTTIERIPPSKKPLELKDMIIKS